MAREASEKVLNKEQLEAVEFGQGPLLIIAGAGTGKTTVITERIKHLISSGLAKPREILALTFTEKAAREMEERVDQALPYGYTEMWISTFHSFCDRILRAEALQIGLDPGYKLMTEPEMIQFLIKNLFSLKLKYFRPLGNPTKFIDGLLNHFSRLKDEDITPGQYLEWAKGKEDKYQELASAFRTYEELKTKESLMDFGDLITNCLRLFRDRKKILQKYKEQFKYILIDEFQDTNIAQNELILLLAGESANLTVVADDDQCLPPNTKIKTQSGDKNIQEVKVGERVITAVGKGYMSFSIVTHLFKKKKKTRFLTFTTDQGATITTTDNHKMFCLTPARVYENKNVYYVYLMHRLDFGWRLGITNDLAQRLRLERSADRIIGIKACKSETEARCFEAIYSLRYSIPTVCFKARHRVAIKDEWLEKLYKEIDTEENILRLASELGIDLDGHHYCLGAVVRGGTNRIKVNLRICKRRHRTEYAKGRYLLNPSVLHEISLETSDQSIVKKLEQNGFEILTAKKGWRIRICFGDLSKVESVINKLLKLTGGILDVKFDVGKRNIYSRQAQVMAASNVLPGLFLPVLRGYEIQYEKVIDRQEYIKEQVVYDLEVEKTHNYIANNIVVHNSIYKWRGAAVSNVIQFRKSYPKAKIVVLTTNYRSTQEILDRAYKLVQNNNPDRLEVKEKIDKKLISARGIKGEKIELIYRGRVEDEAEEVTNKIQELIRKDYQPKDIAILVRANNHAEPFARALGRAGIPFQFLGPGQLFRQPEVKDLIAYLRVLYNFEDSVSLYRVLSMKIFDLSGRDLAAVNNYSRRFNLSLFETCEQADKIFLSLEAKEKIKKIVAMVYRHLDLVPKESAGQILYYFLADTGLLQKMTDYKTTVGERQVQNISKLFDRLKTYEIDHEDAMIMPVVDWLNLSMNLGESPLATNTDWTEEDRVNILTVHSAKGLEFPVVFLINLVVARFPTRERREQIPLPDELIKEILPEGDYHLEEERRLFYVGLTRAKDRVFLTAADYYADGKREKKISPFVVETLGEVKKDMLPQSSQLSIFDWQKNEEPDTPLSQTPLPINYLSYSQIESFSHCPLQYRYRYIQKIPTSPSAAASFGDTIHRTLNEFYQLVLAGQKMSSSQLLAIYEKSWSPLGYSSKAHEARTRKQGERILLDFFKKDYLEAKSIPQSLEQIFVIKIASNLKVGGKIDRVDLKGNRLEIIDYKTGKVVDQKEVDKSLQLTVYALAAADRGIFNKKPEEIILTLYFLDSGEKKQTTRTGAELEKAKKIIIQKAEEISQSKFLPKPGPLCDFCDFKIICEAWR